MANGSDLGPNGVLSVVPPAAYEAYLAQQDKQAAEQQQPITAPVPELVSYIRGQFEIFRNHRNTAAGWSNRMIEALRTFNGQYNPTKFQEVVKFGGSQIYARLSAQKCRATTSLLRDIYLGSDRPWAIKPPADPQIPPDILAKIDQLLGQEQQMVAQTSGQPPNPDDARNRKMLLLESARDAAKKKARDQAGVSEDKIEEILRDGEFYHALAEFLVDLPIFPFACLKGPEVKIQPKLVWPPGGGAQPQVQYVPRLMWVRVSPFDLWWTPGVADIANANIIEKSRLTRAELNDLLDLPGFNHDEVYAVLQEYGQGGLYDAWDTTDAERAVLESRENPAWNRSGLITQFEFNGNVLGQTLQDYGMPGVLDPLRDYHIRAWVIGSHAIKVIMSPSPRQRHPYFITSFEKVPGTVIGNGLVDIVADLQEASNATLRSLVNNISISSGPQVVINDDRILPTENTDDLYPWKRWHARNDPVGNNTKAPIEFYQPTDNSQSLLMVFKALTDLSDDVSAIPKYVGGSQVGGGAGRTASGLAMLMGNASKLLQTVAANIDRDVMEVALTQLSDLILLTDTSGLLTGEENLVVQGVNVAIQRETIRQRQLEFLQHTANPMDASIIGITGRGEVLRAVSNTIGLDGDQIVPSEQELEQRQQQNKAQQQSGPINQRVEQGVQAGVEAGVKRISTELTAGLLAARSQLPEGAPVHIGTLPMGGPGGPPGNGPPGGPGAPGQPPSGAQLPAMAAQAQGSQPTPPNQSRGPQTNVTGNQPKFNFNGSGRPPPPAGGPG